MKYKLFLDDERNPIDIFTVFNGSDIYQEEWVIVRSYSEFIKHILKNNLPSVVSFDHDLGLNKTKEKNGYDCAKWLVYYCDENNLKLPDILIHSQNTVGVDNIFHYLNNAKKHLNL